MKKLLMTAAACGFALALPASVALAAGTDASTNVGQRNTSSVPQNNAGPTGGTSSDATTGGTRANSAPGQDSGSANVGKRSVNSVPEANPGPTGGTSAGAAIGPATTEGGGAPGVNPGPNVGKRMPTNTPGATPDAK